VERKRNVQPETDKRLTSAAIRKAAEQIADMPHEVERRNRGRQVLAPVQATETVRLVDLSTHGCSLGFAVATALRQGQFVRLAFHGQSDAVRAIVRWSDGCRVGVEFTRGLPGPAIDAILGGDSDSLVGLL